MRDRLQDRSWRKKLDLSTRCVNLSLSESGSELSCALMVGPIDRTVSYPPWDTRCGVLSEYLHRDSRLAVVVEAGSACEVRLVCTGADLVDEARSAYTEAGLRDEIHSVCTAAAVVDSDDEPRLVHMKSPEPDLSDEACLTDTELDLAD